jgi:pimeloyl-ACP methyl ester carboxylesterase
MECAEVLRDFGFPATTALESRWTVVDGRKMHSRSSGAGGEIPFVLIHGLVISSLYMIPLAEFLAGRSAVHALDLPGFGRSEAPREILSIPQLAEAVLAWMTAAGIERCHLVANSLGCEVAAHVAVKAPARVASTTLVGPTLDPHAHALLTQTLRLIRDAFHEPARLWFNWLVDFFRAGPRRSFGTTRAMFRDHLEKQLPHVAAPTLVIRGEHDPTVPQPAGEEVVALLPRSTLLVIPGGWHCVHYTAPAVVGAAVERWIESVRAASY